MTSPLPENERELLKVIAQKQEVFYQKHSSDTDKIIRALYGEYHDGVMIAKGLVKKLDEFEARLINNEKLIDDHSDKFKKAGWIGAALVMFFTGAIEAIKLWLGFNNKS